MTTRSRLNLRRRVIFKTDATSKLTTKRGKMLISEIKMAPRQQKTRKLNYIIDMF
jgi:hypothetical protein